MLITEISAPHVVRDLPDVETSLGVPGLERTQSQRIVQMRGDSRAGALNRVLHKLANRALLLCGLRNPEVGVDVLHRRLNSSHPVVEPSIRRLDYLHQLLLLLTDVP